jgi:hypothetical protein
VSALSDSTSQARSQAKAQTTAEDFSSRHPVEILKILTGFIGICGVSDMSRIECMIDAVVKYL